MRVGGSGSPPPSLARTSLARGNAHLRGADLLRHQRQDPRATVGAVAALTHLPELPREQYERHVGALRRNRSVIEPRTGRVRLHRSWFSTQPLLLVAKAPALFPRAPASPAGPGGSAARPAATTQLGRLA